jgi:flavin prenyltransferase
MKRVIVGLSGASGQVYGIRLLQVLRTMPGIETHLVVTRAARVTIAQETDWQYRAVEALASKAYRPEDVAAPIASGSFAAQGMIVAPCSIKSLSAIANSYADDLLARSADVQLKEGRPVLLMVRETPLHLGHIELLERAARIGCVIFPPVPAFYARPSSIQDIVDATVGRALARIGIDNGLYARWGETVEDAR